MSMDKTKIKRAMALSFVAIGTAFAGLSILAKVKKRGCRLIPTFRL